MVIGLLLIALGGWGLVGVLRASDLGLGGKAMGAGFWAAMMLLGFAMIRFGRALTSHPTPGRRGTARGGCLGSVLGAIAFWVLCFRVITEEEAQLACLFFPVVGALLGGLVGALVGWLMARISPPPPAWLLSALTANPHLSQEIPTIRSPAKVKEWESAVRSYPSVQADDALMAAGFVMWRQARSRAKEESQEMPSALTFLRQWRGEPEPPTMGAHP